MITILADSVVDEGYKDNVLSTSDPVKAYTEQIKMALETSVGTILGSESFFDLENLVFEQNLDNGQIKERIVGVISNFCSFYPAFQTTVSVSFTKGELRDICLIDVVISGGSSVKILIQ